MEKTLTGLLGCETEAISQLHRWEQGEGEGRDSKTCPRHVSENGKQAAQCENASLSLVKTIRVHTNRLLPWLLERGDLRVVHLVRDPRWGQGGGGS